MSHSGQLICHCQSVIAVTHLYNALSNLLLTHLNSLKIVDLRPPGMCTTGGVMAGGSLFHRADPLQSQRG